MKDYVIIALKVLPIIIVAITILAHQKIQNKLID